jgi:hypothetical protein
MDDRCTICGKTKSLKHILWECRKMYIFSSRLGVFFWPETWRTLTSSHTWILSHKTYLLQNFPVNCLSNRWILVLMFFLMYLHSSIQIQWWCWVWVESFLVATHSFFLFLGRCLGCIMHRVTRALFLVIFLMFCGKHILRVTKIYTHLNSGWENWKYSSLKWSLETTILVI